MVRNRNYDLFYSIEPWMAPLNFSFTNGPWMAPLFSEAFFRKIDFSPPFKGIFLCPLVSC